MPESDSQAQQAQQLQQLQNRRRRMVHHLYCAQLYEGIFDTDPDDLEPEPILDPE